MCALISGKILLNHYHSKVNFLSVYNNENFVTNLFPDREICVVCCIVVLMGHRIAKSMLMKRPILSNGDDKFGKYHGIDSLIFFSVQMGILPPVIAQF